MKESKLWIFHLFKAYPNIARLSFFVIIANLASLLSPVIFSQIIDKLGAGDFDYITGDIAVVLILSIAIIALNILISLTQNKSTISYQDKLRVKLWHNLNIINLEDFEVHSIGEWQSKLLYDISVIATSTQVFVSTFIPAGILLAGSFFIIATKQIFILAIVFGVIFLNILIYIFFKKSIFALAEKYRKSMMVQNQFLLDIVQLIPIIRIFLLKEKFSNKLEENLSQTRQDNISLNNKSICLSSFLSISIEFIKLFVLIISVCFCAKGLLSVGEVVLYQILLTQALSALNQIFSISPQIEVAKESYLSLSPFISKKLLAKEEDYASIDANKENIIEFKKLSFKYKNAQNLIFEDMDFTVKRDSTACIYGKIGTGKTSLTKLIAKLYTATEGDIHINLKAKSKMPLAYVGQSVPIFQSSLLENIRLFDDNISSDKIADRIRCLKLDKFFSRFNCDLGTEISQSTLSGGQIQCIGILRALIREPQILILDEITNNLDISAKMNIYKFINSIRGKLSIIIISHDTDCYDISDEVYLISNKKLKKINDKSDLIEALI